MADAPYLPEEIIHQIFFRMPTKPLFRLKCLSKHWNRVISDPKFIKSRSRRMIFLPSQPFHAIDNNTADPSMIKLFSPNFIYPGSYKEITIVGSFNGIVLLVLKYRDTMIDYRNQYDHHMILYNPLSGEFKTLPHPPSLFDSYSYYYVYGFGYGTTADDLKIVRLKNDSKYYDVFDLKTWTWSGPSELIRSYESWDCDSGTFANGFLYWNVIRTHLILALDIKSMVSSEIETPDTSYRLGTYNGRLCMLCPQINMVGYRLRVMNEHGFGGESWSTVCSFASSFKSLISGSSALGLLCILDDGKLLLMLKSSKKLLIYDDMLKKDSYKEVNALTSFVRAGRLEAVEYVESLISPSNICSASI